MKVARIVVYLFCFIGITANAQTSYQTTKPIVCDSVQNVTTIMKEQYGEEPVWFGNDLQDNSKYVMLTNHQTKTWTFVQFTKEWACVLGVGTGESGNLINLGKSVNFVR